MLLHQAQTQMGIKLDGSKSFSDDVLKIELTGPQLEHFSVIDVPGIFRNKTKGKTSEKDIELVREMVQSYMESPRSIMLAVIAANVDVANQEILGLAEKYDPSGERTIGILTKPDLVGRGSEPAVIGLMDGSHHNLLSDWHVVRNPGQAELEDEDTNRHLLEEKFFREEKPWRTIPKRDVGVAALRIKLQDALHDHVKRGFECKSFGARPHIHSH